MAGKSRRGQRRPITICRRLALGAVALIGSAALCTPAIAQSAPSVGSSASATLAISGDSVLATKLPSFGQTAITVTRPDAMTGTPVVIGKFAGTGNPFSPFSVNTTTPSPLNPSGDCWQKGALSQALTPDLQPGDTVTLTQAGLLSSGSISTSAVVQASDLANATLGPIAGCSAVAPWAHNAITSAPSAVDRSSGLTVSGVAQPLATDVSVAASDGANTTSPVSVTPAADGSWSATIPAAQLEPLANAGLTVTPVFAVPDVSTGAQAHIAGVSATVTKTGPSTPPSAGPVQATQPAPAAKPTPKPPRRARVTGLRAASRVSLADARRHGITASFIVPQGTHLVQVQLMHGRSRVYTAIVRSQRAGTRQTVTIPTSLAKLLRAGTYTLAIKAGPSRAALGSATTRSVQIT